MAAAGTANYHSHTDKFIICLSDSEIYTAEINSHVLSMPLGSCMRQLESHRRCKYCTNRTPGQLLGPILMTLYGDEPDKVKLK